MAERDEPGIIAFSNPIDPDAPPIKTTAELALFPTKEGGLRQPINVPTPSVVFRRLDRDEIVGYTGVIESGADRLNPGATFVAEVVFVGVPGDQVAKGKEFALWHARDIGRARVLSIHR